MNNYTIHRLRHWTAALTALLAMLLSACINDYDTCPVQEDGDNMVSFRFQMVSNNIERSRATDSSGHEEIASEWPYFEDKIVEGDFAFFIFVKDTSDDWKMIMSMTDLRTTNDANMTVNGMSGVWMVTASIAKSELEEAIGYKIESGSDVQVPLRVAVVANASCGNTSLGGRINYDRLKKDNFTAFIEEANNLIFSINSLHNSNEGSSAIDGIYKGAIPMYGMNEFTLSNDDLFYSDKQNPAWMGQVDLLRSLAKIRVLDNIENKDPDTGLPRIEEVTVESATPQAYVLPYQAETFSGNQIDYPRIILPSGSTGNVYSLKLGYVSQPSNVVFGYLPEQVITAQTPYLRIKVTFELDEQGRPTAQKIFDVPLNGYQDVDFKEKFGLNIIRNHIYTLNVVGVNTDTELTLDVKVADWTEASFELDYTQTVIIPPEFRLRFSNQDGQVDNDNGIVVIKPWGQNTDGTMTYSPLTCTFGIQTPIGATWTAYLNTIDGEQNAFAFLNADGDLVPHISGVVDNKRTSIRVVSQDPEPSESNKARLQVYVRLGDGTMLEAVLTPDNTVTPYKSYTIVQNPL